MKKEATNLRRDNLQHQEIAQTVANCSERGLLPNLETSKPELLSRLKLVAKKEDKITANGSLKNRSGKILVNTLVGCRTDQIASPTVELKTNKFGKDYIVSPLELKGKTYITSAACMTVYAEATGWANKNNKKIVKTAKEADNIVVLSCQVTDLAILNDLKTIETLQRKAPDRKYFIGGCLAQRFDVPLPGGVVRLDHLRADYQPLVDRGLVNYEKPFWVPHFEKNDSEDQDGHLFRNMYPLRIGSGCHGKCKYCTIKTTRGKAYDLDPDRLEREFATHDDIVIIADSVASAQIIKFSGFAIKHGNKISFRNVEPQNVVAAKDTLIALANMGLLRILHTPVQATASNALKLMNRSEKQVRKVLSVVKELKKAGVYTATNIIIDYDGCENDFEKIYSLFDYVSWNPYWNGDFNAEKAEQRWKHYIEKPELRGGK